MGRRETFVIVGANMAGGAAVTTLRSEGFEGRIVLIGDERTGDMFTAPAGEAERLFYGFSLFHCLPVGMVGEGVHFHGLFFTGLTTTFGPHRCGCDEASMSMQPSPQHDVFWQCGRPSSEIEENFLGDIFGQMSITADESSR